MINFEDGQLIENAYIEIDGVKQYVIPAKYSGRTPLSAFVMNKMQKDLMIHTYTMTITADTEKRSRSRITILVQGTVTTV